MVLSIQGNRKCSKHLHKESRQKGLGNEKGQKGSGNETADKPRK